MKTVEEMQQEFNAAMSKYDNQPLYKITYKVVSVIVVALQVVLVAISIFMQLPVYQYLFALLIAYFLTDFLNGLVHMYMDNNSNYGSFFGPFIASFHLHHKTQKYKDSNIFAIYFNESGSKFWLVIYLALTLILYLFEINSFVLLVLIYVGVLSSIAEVSHYLCHNSSSKFVSLLQRYRVLLPMHHHQKHHQLDNQSYAFLNGTTDFLIDKIANRLYFGYKNSSDQHSDKYDSARVV